MKWAHCALKMVHFIFLQRGPPPEQASLRCSVFIRLLTLLSAFSRREIFAVTACHTCRATAMSC